MGTHYQGMLYAAGAPVLPGGLVTPGDIYFLDPTNGSDGNSGKAIDDAFASLTVAYAALTAGQHDVLFYVPGSSSISLSAEFEWAKDYTHFIGLAAPTRVGQRARIFQTADETDLSPLITISGDGCRWENLYIFQGVDDNGSLINVSVTGGRNFFRSVHFAGGGHATMAIDGGASLLLNGAEECTFVDCTIGVDTIAAATGMAGMRVDGDAKRCIFENCLFTLYAGHAGAKFVEIVDNAGFDRYLVFKNCAFVNDCVTYTLTEAFTVPSGMGSVTHRIILLDSFFLGVGDIEDSDRGIVFANMGTYTAGGNSGIMETVAAT